MPSLDKDADAKVFRALLCTILQEAESTGRGGDVDVASAEGKLHLAELALTCDSSPDLNEASGWKKGYSSSLLDAFLLTKAIGSLSSKSKDVKDKKVGVVSLIQTGRFVRALQRYDESEESDEAAARRCLLPFLCANPPKKGGEGCVFKWDDSKGSNMNHVACVFYAGHGKKRMLLPFAVPKEHLEDVRNAGLRANSEIREKQERMRQGLPTDDNTSLIEVCVDNKELKDELKDLLGNAMKWALPALQTLVAGDKIAG